MSVVLKDQVLSTQITDKQVAVLVSQALRREHAATDAVVKRIARATQASPKTVRKWYEGQNAPSSANLLTLMSTYEGVLKTMLHILGRGDLMESGFKGNDPPLNALRKAIYGDSFVTINVIVSNKAALSLNQRQLWFLGQLQQDRVIKTEDIGFTWKISIRTAKRDIAGLVREGVIRFSGPRKKGRFILGSAVTSKRVPRILKAY